VGRLIAQHERTAADIMKITDVAWQMALTSRDKLLTALESQGNAPGNRPVVCGAVQT
jgi:hypothetical protein